MLNELFVFLFILRICIYYIIAAYEVDDGKINCNKITLLIMKFLFMEINEIKHYLNSISFELGFPNNIDDTSTKAFYFCVAIIKNMKVIK